jgi:hypothetical protein
VPVPSTIDQNAGESMKNAGIARPLVLTSMVLFAVSCASRGSPANEAGLTGAGSGVAIQVTNDLVPPNAIAVWIVPETGSRRRLGTIQPNGTQTFTFSPISASMDHRLQAEYEGGPRTGLEASNSTPTSNPFTLQGVRAAVWRVSTPGVTLQR